MESSVPMSAKSDAGVISESGTEINTEVGDVSEAPMEVSKESFETLSSEKKISDETSAVNPPELGATAKLTLDADVSFPSSSPSESSKMELTDHSTANMSANIDEETPKVKKRKKFSPLDRLIIDDGRGKEPKKKPKKEVELPKLKGNGDIFCWNCHKPGTLMAKCTRCSKVYHATVSCSYLDKDIPENWICYECHQITEAIEEEKNLPKKFDKESLNSLLHVATDQLAKLPGAEYLINPVDDPEFSDYKDYIFSPMSLSDINEKISKNSYTNFHSFIIDLKLLIHNSYIYNTPISEITHAARTVVRKGYTLVEEIKNCPECVVNSFEENGFTKACTEVHIPVWAKYKLYPYWPAKLIKVFQKGDEKLVQVKFFGAHNRADLPVDMVYLYSEKAPSKYISRSKSHFNNYMKSREEMKLYINNLAIKFHEFKFAPFEIKLNDKNLDEQIKLMLPKYPAKRISKVAEMKLIKELNISRKKNALDKGVKRSDDIKINDVDQLVENESEKFSENDVSSKRKKISTNPESQSQIKQATKKSSGEIPKNHVPQEVVPEDQTVADSNEKSQDESSSLSDDVLKKRRGRPFKQKRGRWSKVDENAPEDSDQKDNVNDSLEAEAVPVKRKRGRPKSMLPPPVESVTKNNEVSDDLATTQTSSSPVPLKETTAEDLPRMDVSALKKPQGAVMEEENALEPASSVTEEPDPVSPDKAPAAAGTNTPEADVPAKRKRGRSYKARRRSRKSIKTKDSLEQDDSESKISNTRVLPKSSLEKSNVVLQSIESSQKQENIAKTKSLSPQGTHKFGGGIAKSRSISPRTASQGLVPRGTLDSESELSSSDGECSDSQNDVFGDISQYIDSEDRRAVVLLERMDFPLLEMGKIKNSNSMEDLLSPNELQALKKKQKGQPINQPTSSEMPTSKSNQTKKPLVTPEELKAYQKKKNLSRIELEALQEEMEISSPDPQETEGHQVQAHKAQVNKAPVNKAPVHEQFVPEHFMNEQEEYEEEQDSGSESDMDFLDPEKISYEDIMDLIAKCKSKEDAQEYAMKAYKILGTFYATTTQKLTEQCDEEIEVISRIKDEYEQKFSAKWEKKLEAVNNVLNERFTVIKEMFKKRVKNTDQFRWCNVCHSVATIYCCYGTHYCSEECQAIHWNEEHCNTCHQHKITFTTDENNEIVMHVEKKDRTLEECFILSEKLKERKREKANKDRAEFVISSVMSLPPDDFSPSQGGLSSIMDQPSTSRHFMDQPSTSMEFNQPSTSIDYRNLPSTSGLGRTGPSNSVISIASDGSDSD